MPEVNHDRARFHEALRRLLADNGHHFTGTDLGRAKGQLFHRVTALTDDKGVVTHQLDVPEGADTWSIDLARHLVAKFDELAGPDTWYAFECSNPTCYAKGEGNETGVVLDVRLPWDGPTPPMKCPICQKPMHFSARWDATESGHGSRATGVTVERTL